MKLDTEFIRLPLTFDVARLSEEVLAFEESDWRPHPQGNPGNSALPLIAVEGDPMNDAVKGRMVPTPHLLRCEYLRQVLASFNTVFGRTRLMRLDGNAEATLHVDSNYYWAERVRVHVPIVTSPEIEFLCNKRSLHMGEGESWVFDAWRRHNVLNPTGDRRIHLVADTVGSKQFWELVNGGERPFGEAAGPPLPIEHVPHRPGDNVVLETERSNFSIVMGPPEQQRLFGSIVEDMADTNGSDEPQRLREMVEAFLGDWRQTWEQHAEASSGWPTYRGLLDGLDAAMKPLDGKVKLFNETDATEIVRQMMVRPALNPDLAPSGPAGSTPVAAPQSRAPATPTPAAPAQQAGAGRQRRGGRGPRRFSRPIFIVAPPRSGTTLLFETVARSPSVWTIGGESHRVIEGLPGLQPANRGWDSNRLTATDAQPRAAERLRDGFFAQLRDRDGQRPAEDATGLRLLEKTPKNALRVPFLQRVFPEAMFLYLYREPRESLASMIAAWESGRFVTYPNLPDWEGPPWSMLLTPEWRKLSGKPLAEIVASQWTMATKILLDDLERLEPERWCVVAYDDLVREPQTEIERLCEFVGIEWDQALSTPLPLSRHTVTPPDPDKWKQHEAELEAVLPGTGPLAERAHDWIARPPQSRPRAATGTGPSPFRSINTASLPEVLEETGSSLLVTTYQTGKLVCVRRTETGLNTHFRNFESPMGLAWQGGRLAVGTKSQIWEYQNVPAVAEKINATNKAKNGSAAACDACFVPRRTHYTGDVRIHEIGYAEGQLWIVATRFSCLATLDGEHSFVPRWRPPFISGLTADDRCHLNGMAVIDNRVRYVTALGTTDEAGGWRENKARGGVLIDVDSSETVVSGLSMPHSPRWYRDRMWVLESGEGTLATLDLDSGSIETVTQLPGFTRGLAFAGPIAFVGLSEVREATTFGGLPLTGRLEERQCGVWMVNIETGEIVGMLRFEDLVQEIFAVEVLPGITFPEVAEHGSDAVNLSYVLPEAELAAAAT